MTAQEKAHILVTQHYCFHECYCTPIPELEKEAKSHALMLVDEILNLPIYWDSTKDAEPDGTIEFWQEVKKEIKKL